MDFLRKFWPFSFKEKNEVKDLVIMVVIYAVIPTAVGIVAGILGRIPFIRVVGYILSWCNSLISLYCTAGIVFTFLNYFKVGPFAGSGQQ